MATIIKNNNKKGVTYRIQVVAQTREGRKTHLTTWTPPPGLSASQTEAAVKKYAAEFEKQIKEQAKNHIELPVTIKVNDLIPHYLEFIKKHCKLTHYVGTKRRLLLTQKKLGHFRVMDLTPFIIQDFIDEMDEETYTESLAVPKPQLKEVMQEQGIGTYNLAKKSGCSCSTTKNAVNGKNIEVGIANRIAKLLKVEPWQIFEVITTETPYAYATKNGAVTALSGLLGFAIRNMIITTNYAEDKFVTKFKNEETDSGIKYMEDFHINEFLSKLNDESDIRMKVNAYLTIMMGYRRGEVAGLEWQDIDLEKGKIKISRASLTIQGMGIIESTPKSKTSIREGYMPKQLTELLREYKVWWDDYTAKLGDKAAGSQRLFLQANGKPIYPSTLYCWLQKQEKKFGLPVVSMHSIRKTCLSMQKHSGLVDIDSIVRDAGHADSRVTQEHYIKQFDSEKQKVAQAKEVIFAVNTKEALVADEILH